MALINADNTVSTYPTISIATFKNAGGAAAGSNAQQLTGQSNVALSFEYLPESMSFGVNAVYDVKPVPLTAAQTMTYANSKIDDIHVSVKVVAGCNNAIVRFGTNQGSSNWANFSGSTAAKTTRNDLIQIAKVLYSLVLPTGQYGGSAPAGATSVAAANASGTGSEVRPPPTCNLIVGPYCACVGGFQSVTITFNGPYDMDGSPTDMDVDFTFIPSEFYDSSANATGFAGGDLTAKLTMTSDSEVSGAFPYAILVGQNTNAPPPSNPEPTTSQNNNNQSEVAAASIRAVQLGQAPGTTPSDGRVAEIMRSAVSNNKTDVVTATRIDNPQTGQTTYQINNKTTGFSTTVTYAQVQAVNQGSPAPAFQGTATQSQNQPQSQSTAFETSSAQFVGTSIVP